MKTTVNLPDALLQEAQRAAAEDHTTLKALIEMGLRLALAQREQPQRFTLRDASVPGRGLQPEFRDADWARFRDAIYGSDPQ